MILCVNTAKMFRYEIVLHYDIVSSFCTFIFRFIINSFDKTYIYNKHYLLHQRMLVNHPRAINEAGVTNVHLTMIRVQSKLAITKICRSSYRQDTSATTAHHCHYLYSHSLLRSV